MIVHYTLNFHLVLAVVILKECVNERDLLLFLPITALTNHTLHNIYHHLLVSLKLRLPL